MAAQLMRLGAEVRVLDQDVERLTARVVRREARLWRANRVLLYAGGSLVADDPVPDARPLTELLDSWPTDAELIVAGPLARRYGAELVLTLPALRAALVGPIDGRLVGDVSLEDVPGLLVRAGEDVTSTSVADLEPAPPAPPAWQALPMDAYPVRHPDGARAIDVLVGDAGAAASLEQVRHAVRRGGARLIVFADRDLAADPRGLRELSRGMLSAAPGTPWACRVRADRIDPMLAVTLGNGGCREVLVCSPSAPDEPAAMPMDDPARARIEGAVEAIRVTGMSAVVEHVIGRPGHDRGILAAWSRWFGDRRMLVHAQVRMVHAGDRGPREPDLQTAHRRAGCWDNELEARDVVRAVRQVSDRARLQAAASGA
jgi:hypothetical protein